MDHTRIELGVKNYFYGIVDSGRRKEWIMEERIEREYDLDRELAQLEDDNEQFNEVWSKFLTDQAARKYKPAWSGQALLDAPEPPLVAYVPDFIYAGCIAALVGRPKAGKSTFMWSMIHELMRGKNFLGKETRVPGNVLYVSEQSRYSFKEQLNRLPEEMGKAIMKNPKFFVMLPEHHLVTRLNNQESNATSWQERLGLWKQAVKATQADLLVVDTFGQYADLGPQGENDNAMMAKRILEFRQLQKERPSLAIVLICHTTKASGKKRFLELQDIRGGSALAGGLDHGVTLQKTASGPQNMRYINMESRMLGDKKLAVSMLENGSFYGIDPEASIRDIQEELGISFRQARKLKQQLTGTEDDENTEDEPLPTFDRG